MKAFLHSAAIGAAALALTLAISGTSRAGQAAPSNTATIEVSVPADAKVWFEDYPTVQTGSERYFESPPLTPGKTYSYVVTAQWRGPDGKDVVRKQEVSVRANEGSSVEFVSRAPYYSSYYTTQPGYYSGYDGGGYSSGYYGGGRGLFSGYYRVGNVIINGRHWGDIGYRYSRADLIRW
jgi:uncharacterized protein (TIGR03000 family)